MKLSHSLKRINNRPMTEQEKTDEEIAREIQRGNADAIQFLIERYEPKMTRYARKFLFAGDDVKDVVQEVFIRAYVNIQSFDASQRFSPWIYRIAHNIFINELKKKTKERRNFSLFDADTLFPQPVAPERADSDVERKEMRKILDASLGTLDPKYREPIALYYFEDMDYKAIAEILQVPVSTVGIRIRRGKALLKKNIVR